MTNENPDSWWLSPPGPEHPYWEAEAAAAERAGGLLNWTIYASLPGLPAGYHLVQPFVVTSAGPEPRQGYLAPSLDAARAPLVYMELFRIGRSPQDEPSIVETWL